MAKTRITAAVRGRVSEENDTDQSQNERRKRSPLRGTRPKPTVILRKEINRRNRLQFTLTKKEMRRYDLMEAREKKRIEKFKKETNEAIAFLITSLMIDNKFHEIRRNIEDNDTEE